MQIYHDFSKLDVEEWADPRQTSIEIAQAILEVASDWDEAQTIWENGCDAATNSKIIARAFELTTDDELHLWWGIAKQERPSN